MVTVNSIIGFALAVASLIALLFPKQHKSAFLKRTCWAIITVGCLFSIFNSNQYLHWKHFDDDKIRVLHKQLPHVIGTENNLLHEYIIGIENNYLTSDIKKVELEVNSRMPLIDYELLLSDSGEETVDVKIKNSSNLIIKTNSLKGGQVLWLSFRCKPLLKNNLPEDITLILKSTPIKLRYEIYNVIHSETVDSGLNVTLSNQKYFQKDILFKKIVAIDHRKVFTNKTDYQYCQFSFDNNMRAISVLSTNDGFIKVIYEGLKGKLKYKSKNKINHEIKKVNILRMIVFKNDFFLIEGTFEFIKENV
jgi:hypothetical protein